MINAISYVPRAASCMGVFMQFTDMSTNDDMDKR